MRRRSERSSASTRPSTVQYVRWDGGAVLRGDVFSAPAAAVRNAGGPGFVVAFRGTAGGHGGVGDEPSSRWWDALEVWACHLGMLSAQSRRNKGIDPSMRQLSLFSLAVKVLLGRPECDTGPVRVAYQNWARNVDLVRGDEHNAGTRCATWPSSRLTGAWRPGTEVRRSWLKVAQDAPVTQRDGGG